MTTAIFSVFFFLIGALVASKELSRFGSTFGIGKERAQLERVIHLLRELEETLQTGLVPRYERWRLLKELPAPWGKLSWESLENLRTSGGAILPTLKRLKLLAQDHSQSLVEARSKSSQAWAQAVVCGSLTPLFGFALYLLLPGMSERAFLWSALTAFASFLSLVACLWLIHIAETARWGGLSAKRRSWVLLSYCAGERLLAQVRAGLPADLSWANVLQFVSQESSELALEWGFSIWETDQTKKAAKPGVRSALIELGERIRKSVQVSLMEGSPCTERIETALFSLRNEVRCCIEKELALIGTRALKPLFLLVAPSLLGLLGSGLVVSWLQAGI